MGTAMLRRWLAFLLLLAAATAGQPGPGPGRKRSPMTQVSALDVQQMQSRAVDTRVQLEIQEGEPRGAVVGAIPIKPGFTYRFNENPREFYLNASTGEIVTNVVLDREALRSDRFDLVVLSSQPTYPIEVRILVLDVNDNAPEFPEPSIHVTFSESASPGTRLLLDTASDRDAGINGVSNEYKLVSDDEEVDNKFKLVVTSNPSGETSYLHLETTGKLDRETRASYQLNVSARDGGTPPRYGYLQVNVTIVDVNDNPPIFDHSDYIVSLNESVPPGTAVLQVMATDSDVGDNARITYYLADGENQFAVDPETGVISTTETLNCPQNCPPQATVSTSSGCQKSCVFTVFARDHGSPRQDGRTYVTVNLLDTNDHDPIIKFRYFPPTASFATVDENAKNGSVVAAVSVIDLDEGLNGKTTVEIRAGNELGHFRLVNTASFDIVRVNGVLDREQLNKYNLTLVATDSGTPQRSAIAFLIIYVNDINDHEPVFAKTEYSAVLSELAPVGTFVASIIASDEDTGVNSNIFYAFVAGNEHRWFDIDSDSGLVTTRAALDREVQGTVELKVSARDGGPNPKWAYTRLRVTILDENDKRPQFSVDKLNASLSESAPPQTLIAMLSATDQDQGTNGSVSYSLHSDVQQEYPGVFSLDSTTGQLTTRTKLDREKIAKYEIAVVAKDKGVPPQSSTATVFLSVDDVNDNSPEFYPQRYFVPVSEDTKGGSSILSVTATDQDEGENAQIEFSIVDGGDGLFKLDRATGILSLMAPLSTSHKPLHRLRISAKDKGDRKAVDDAIVEIIKASHLEELKFESPVGYHFEIREDHDKKEASVGREVGRVRVASTSRDIKYHIVFGDPKKAFQIDERTGLITSASRIDRETAASYRLTCVARAGPALMGRTEVNVTILDENDNAPQFSRDREEVKLRENAPAGHEVYLARAVDRDAGSNSRVSYSLNTNPGEQFRIAEATGVIYLNKPMTAEPGTTITLEITASDSGEPSLTSRHTLLITIEDVNDHTPVFDHTSYETSILESAPVNDRFFALAASDADLGANGRVNYEITEGNSENKFGVFPDGYLYVKSPLDRENRDYYSLVVTARDEGEPPRSSQVPVVIHVIDENDNKPEFTNGTFNFFVRENQPPDTFVGKLTATDLDIGRNAELTFSLLGAQQADFVVDPKNGFLKTLRQFDREELVKVTGQSHVVLEAVVTDNGVTKLKDKVKVNVYITDVNDNVPKFLRTPYKVQISEASPANSQVLRVYTVDADEGLNGDVFYAITSGDDEHRFAMDEATGQITLARTLDRETQARYDLQVSAFDAGEGVTLTATATVRVDVLDENDNAPEFSQSEARIAISETTPVNTKLVQFRATDVDLGVNSEVTFSVAAGNRRDTFHVDPSSGVLYLHRPLDFEEINAYHLNITASDGGNPRLSTTVPFSVRVLDANDNPPVFPSTAIVRQIQEGIRVNTPIVTVTAEDPDSGANGQVRYAIAQQEPPGGHFGIDPTVGVIHTLRPIDREAVDTFRLTVVATDGAQPPEARLSAEKLVTVIVEDVNDNAPVFASMSAALLPLNPARDALVTHVVANDLDSSTNGLVTYELVSGNTDLFRLHRKTGALHLKRSISEPEARYQLTVKATDEAVQSDRKSTDAYLTIITSGEEGPAFLGEPYTGSVYENEPIGTSMLSVKARHASNAELEYYVTNVTSVSGRPADRLFDVDPKMGTIATAAVLDREGGSDVYEVTVFAVVIGAVAPQTASTKVKISVLDKNDSPPVFKDMPTALSVSEELAVGQTVTTMRAVDPDTLGQLTYSLVSGDETKRFQLDSVTGELRLREPLDRETADTYKVKVRASDGLQFQETTLTIKVTDTNDNPPVFSESAYSFDVPENTARGSRVGEVAASDLDEGTNGQVTYTVISDWANDVFSLNPQSGVFTLTSRLDYEEVQHYIFVVQAQDTGRPSLSSTVTVYFNIVDLNDNAPLFDPMSYSNEIFENVTIGSRVVKVSATDLDSGDNGRLEYSISSGDEDNDFAISENGTIVTARALDREQRALYSLVVTATDQAAPPQQRLSSTVQVTIVLKDVNDMAPEFVSPNETSVPENLPVNTVVMAVKATDKDEGRNSYVEYSLSGEGATSVFTLGPVDGLLRVSGRLDRETKANYTLQVTAKDRGEPTRSTTSPLVLLVLDENDNSPVFDPKQYSASVAENASIGASVLRISATDVDAGLNGRVRYVIAAGDRNRDFSISEDTGVIRVAKNLNFERKSQYSLTVQAEDCGSADVRYDSALLTIGVTDINDNPPTFLDSPYLAYVVENTKVLPASVITVRAFDADTPPYSQVRYFIKEGDSELFKVNASTGEITLHRALDRERQAEYVLTLVAMDTGTPPLTGTGTVRVIVQDMNDHSPEFERQSYSAEVVENSAAGTQVLWPSATDKDAGLNALLRFSLLGDLSERFVVDPGTGRITTAVQLDREDKSVYYLTLVARDSSATEPRAAAANVTIRVRDENDNSPKFAQPKYSVHVQDTTGPGNFVFGARASDEDDGANSRITYSLAGEDASLFALDANTGVLTAARELRAAAANINNALFRLEILATDGGQPASSASTSLDVYLVAANLFPKITSQKTQFTLSEDAEEQVITKVRASSPKSGASGVIRFSIAGGDVGSALRMDPASGEVIVSRGLDYETAPQYEVWVEASDSDTPPLRSVVQLLINLTDANDNAPVLEHQVYNATIGEEEMAPQKVLRVKASDADSGDNGKVLYRLRPVGDVDRAFTMDAETGDIFTSVRLDRESVASYALVVEAVDRGRPQMTGSATVLVQVLDKNDNPPRFTRLFSVNVTENAEVGAFVIQVTSSDLDVGANANATYSFTVNPGEKFRIDPLTGNVTVAGPLDRETQDEYLLKVAAVDGSWRAETPLTITIQDQNDNAPEFEHDYYNFNFPELQRSVAFVGQVSATDRDKQGPNSVISYSLKRPSDSFTVDPASGEIFSKRTARYRHATPSATRAKMEPSPENQHQLIVIATDNGKPPMSSECLVTINVVDANNNAPKFRSKEVFSPVPEVALVGQKIVQVEAKDELDFGVNAEVEYVKMGGNGSEQFELDPTTGWVTVAKPLTGHRLRQYALEIRAVDHGSPPQHSDARLTLVITGDNRHNPVFSTLSYQVIVPENEQTGFSILTVSATDSDDGPNGQVRYNISAGNEQGDFEINPVSGAVTIKRPLDYDTVQFYRLNITATDMAFEPRSATALLTVTLSDVNDNAPQFNQSVYHAYVRENLPVGTALFTANATDADSPKNAIIQYSIVGGSGREVFTIDSRSGKISTKGVFDYEEQNAYTLDILASNPDSPQYGSCKVEVHVTGENEFFPKFVQPVFHFTVSESAGIGTSIGAIQATDQDAGPDGNVFYLLVGSSNDRGFSIGADTGVLTISRRLDRETQSRVVLTILAKNSGSIRGNDTDEAQVVVSIQDGNDPPEFVRNDYEVRIAEDAPTGTSVLGVTAVDKDVRPQNNQFSYSIIGGNTGQAFKVDPHSGIIETSAQLDRERNPEYSLVVGAIDTGSPPQTGTTMVRIMLDDINDNGPMLEPPDAVGYIMENEPAGTSVMTLAATDADLSPNGAPFKYRLVGGEHRDVLAVDTNTGLVKTTKSIDRESTPELHFIVEVSDSGKPPMRAQHHVTAVVLDKNDSPSTPRTVHVLVHAFNNQYPSGKVADVRPNDPDTTGQYSCRLVGTHRGGSVLPGGCDLMVNKPQGSGALALSVSGNDGKHPDVVSTVTVEFIAFDNTSVENSLTMRLENTTASRFLGLHYRPILDALKDRGDVPLLFGLHEADKGLEIQLAIKTAANKYRSPSLVSETLSRKRDVLQQILQAPSMAVNYSPCHNSVCENGGICSASVKVGPENQITDSPSLIFTAPKVTHDFVCRCREGFTGKRCERRQDPCAPNPCQSGGTCRRSSPPSTSEFQCVCPPLHEGRLCELERSNVCAGSPCRNGGSCRESPDGASFFCLCRPGYMGNQCELVSDSCRSNPCMNGGQCVALKPGYKCQCPDTHHGQHCERSSFGFNGLSFMAFQALDAATNDITIVFATLKREALLVYNFGAQTGGRSDFVALQIVNGKVKFSYGGARTAVTTITTGGIVSDGNWHKVTATRNGRVVSLAVATCTEHGDSCHECKPGDSTCYSDDVGPAGTLNFNGQPMLLGGLASAEPLLERPGQLQADDFVGCVHSVAVNGRPLNLSNPLSSRGVDSTCSRSRGSCGAPDPCGGLGVCLARWPSPAMCRCPGGLLAPNCDAALSPVHLEEGAFLEARVSEQHRRMHLLEALYQGATTWRWQEQIPTSAGIKRVALSFRTMQKNGLLLVSTTNNDFTLIEIRGGHLRYMSRVGAGTAVNMTVDSAEVSDGNWHRVSLHSQGRGLRLLLDGVRVGDELDSAGVHDFLDPYLTTIAIGGARTFEAVPSFGGCLANFTINDEIQPLNGSGSIFGDIEAFGKVNAGCSGPVVGAAAAPTPLSIGVTLVIVFFVILIVAILVSFAVFRLRRQNKENPKQNGGGLLGGGGGGNTNLGVVGPGVSGDTSFLDGDVSTEALRSHLAQELVAKKYKEREVADRPHPRPDIIEREVSKSPRPHMDDAPDPGSNDPEMPEHYDLENASSIAPSDIDVVYHYKGYRDGNVRKYKTNPHLPPASFHHKHGHRHSPHSFAPPPSGSSPAPPPPHRDSPRGGNHLLRQSPISPVARDSPSAIKMQSTPLARLSPSSELSQQTPRILTLHDISGKPLQSALLATAQSAKDVLSNSERSLNSHSSGSLHASSQGTKKRVNEPGGKGLTAEEIERLNSRPRTSSLVSTLDAVSSSSEAPRRPRLPVRRTPDQLAGLLEAAAAAAAANDAHDNSSTTDESGNDSFTCSEFEFDNAGAGFEKRDVMFSKLAEEDEESARTPDPTAPPSAANNKPFDAGFDSFRGSLSTLVPSDDELGPPYRPTLGWDYLLNWGPNFESLVGVFKDIAELPDGTVGGRSAALRLPVSSPKPSEEYV
ncbi:cadherin-related tumor suppressor [Neocloeon triangulifer]|uniref:cadherin-related tumor suppressor n=1 Tax=Neocloeon triangulifer TaxID=2078957 RepID=UPI00286EF8DE|nr:cadherin-related tumor suppressor [Neocloeon triangulifer]